ncbi:putative phosphatidylinositolglycan class N (PIG-N) [Lyophyllum shimeji]|uniref:GPI ethanolamine phosphate transferase 1 n=1 Tax=Lyophyllum shimeji TaxID=47721 RepID=A0A9P3PF22_LYOSH|nr:putative phosphatidylinositolglycan class N (PIG-N) [Lyophyllum shimeji]
MFARGATPGKVKTWSYNEEDEDFTKDATALDVWVLDQLKTLFHNATTDATLNAQLRAGKVVFFLHLLGLDTTGHSYRPHSREYMKNIQVVDSIVQQTESLINEFYQDDETSFIFTADHGMSVIGNHGDGDPDNTRTPLIAWGRGVRGPLPDSEPSSHDSYSEPWHLGHLYRRDVEQADVAALMASLLGIDWPVNSVGVLPDVDPTRPGYLAPRLGDETLAKAALVNAKVILEHYAIKHELKKSRTLFYKPFSSLEKSSGPHHQGPYRIMALKQIEGLIRQKQWHAARAASAELIQTGLDGLHYLQTYERRLIRGIVTAAYVGWAVYASLYIFRPADYVMASRSSTWSSFVHATAGVTLAGFWALFAVQRAPWSFYVYIAFPCYFWHQFLSRGLLGLWSQLRASRVSYWQVLGSVVMTLVVLQGMVVGYTYRFVWSIGFALIGVVWPMTWPKGVLWKYFGSAGLWGGLCLAAGIFPVLSVEKKESLGAILAAGTLILVCGLMLAVWILKDAEHSRGEDGRRSLTLLFIMQSSFVVIMMAITASSVRSLQAKQGLPVLNQASGWIILVLASVLPFVLPFASGGKDHTAFSKFLTYFLGFGPAFVILSISVEGLFYVAYSAVLAAWVIMESIVRNGTHRPATPGHSKIKVYHFRPDDLRIALFFLFFVQVGFFGTGNVASISSFYLEPVYRLIPIFSPFFMAALLIFKIVAPYIILAVASALLNDFLHLPPFSLLLVALTLTDGMTIMFFFNVRDTGSWLEIGQSITFFCITSLLLLWSTGICAAGEYLLVDVVATPLVHKDE